MDFLYTFETIRHSPQVFGMFYIQICGIAGFIQVLLKSLLFRFYFIFYSVFLRVKYPLLTESPGDRFPYGAGY